MGCSSCPPTPTAHMAERSCSRTGHPSPVTSRSPCDRPGKQGFLGRLPWEHTVFPRGSWRAGEGSASADLPTIKADKFVPPNRLFLAAAVSAFTQSNLKSLSLSETLLPSSLGSQQEPPHLSQGLRAPSAPHPGAAISLLTHSVPLRKSQCPVIYFLSFPALLISRCLSERRTKPFPQELSRAVR